MNRRQLEAIILSLDQSSDELHKIAARSANTSNQIINLAAYSVAACLLKAARAALEVTDE
ncbi:hypothetical protein LJR221_001469 [Agrobacterium tumefaciens]